MNQIQRLISIHGYQGTFRIAFAKCLGLVLWLTPARRKARAVARAKDISFDRRFGVDTAGMVVPEEQDVVGASWAFGSRYQGIDVESLDAELNGLQIEFSEFTFVDLGSGKGRAVLAASRFPFKRIVGVEYSEILNDAAQKNAERFPAREMKCQQLELICADAVDYSIPAGPLVIFLYNPFGLSIMEKVVQNIRQSYLQQPRRIIVMYFYSVVAEPWRKAEFLAEQKSSQWISIFDSQKNEPRIAAA